MNKQNLSDYIEFSDEKFTKRVVFKEKEATAFVLNFKPGQVLPAHKHPGSIVFLQMLDGEGLFTFDKKEVAAEKHNVLSAEGNEEISFTNNGAENASLYVTLTKIPSADYAKDV